MTRLYIELQACPCGYFGDPAKPCTCSSSMVTRYQKRISGPLMDRIDIHMQLPRVEFQKLRDMRPAQIRKYCVLDDACQALMKTAMRQLQLTARSTHRVLKLSRTIADMAGSQSTIHTHLAEAPRNRPKLVLM